MTAEAMKPMTTPSRVSVIGLGKVGSAMVAAYASRGFPVVGTDRDPSLVECIGLHEAPYEEQDLAKLLSENRERIRCVATTAEAVLQSDISFIIVPTSSAADGTFSTQYVEAACRDVGSALRDKSTYHLVVVVSTILPSDSVERIIPALESTSGKRVGADFGYAYSPSFIAIGSIIRNILYPDFHLVGEYDKRSGDMLQAFYEKTCINEAPVERMSVESAEIAKIALNSYVTQKITFANVLADLCSRVPNADVDSVTHALAWTGASAPPTFPAAWDMGGRAFREITGLSPNRQAAMELPCAWLNTYICTTRASSIMYLTKYSRLCRAPRPLLCSVYHTSRTLTSRMKRRA